MNNMRKLLAIMEDRQLDNPDISYDLQGDSKSATLSGEFTKITATITGPTSAHFTRLANKFKQIDDLNKEIKELRDSANAETKEQLNDLFGAQDKTLTRYVETQSLSITVAKDVKEKEIKTETFDVKAFMQDLYKLVDESLLPAIQELKEQHTHIQRSIQAGRKGAVKVNVKTEESVSATVRSTVERISDTIGELIDLKMSEYGKKLQQLKSRYFSGNLKENNTMNDMRKLMESVDSLFESDYYEMDHVIDAIIRLITRSHPDEVKAVSPMQLRRFVYNVITKRPLNYSLLTDNDIRMMADDVLNYAGLSPKFLDRFKFRDKNTGRVLDEKENKISVGDTVRIKDTAKNVVDREMLGKSGYIKSIRGKEIMVKFADGRSMIVSPQDLDIISESNNDNSDYMESKGNKINENDNDIFKGHDIEDLTTRLEVSHRGGGIEIDLEPLGYPEGARMSAYQNYLGGGMLGAVQSDCNLKDWQYIDGLDEISEHLKRHFHNLTNPEGDEWVDFDYEQNQKMPSSGY